MREIPLTQGKVAIVDDYDFRLLSVFKWHTAIGRYAGRRLPGNGLISLMHREILGLTGASSHVDHINGNGLDNRRINLRIATQQQNMWNQRKREGTSSPYKGVSWDRITLKWQAHICVRYKSVRLGRFASEIEAALAYDRAAIKHFGEFARLNFPHAQLSPEKNLPAISQQDRRFHGRKEISL